MDEAVALELFGAALDFRDLAPWDWMDDDPPFGIHDTETGAVGWCAVVGALREHYGLAIYPGDAGWASFRRVRNRLDDEFDAGYAMDQYVVDFGSRESLSADERRHLKTLGGRCRGAHAWPWIRRAEPWRPLRELVDDEARFVARVLRVARGVCARVRDDFSLIYRGLYLRRDGQDTWVEPPVTAPRPVEPIDEVAVVRALAEVEKVGEDWYGDWCTLDATMLGPAGPVHPIAAFWLHRSSGLVLVHDIVHDPADAPGALARMLPALIRGHGRPSTLVLRRPRALAAFASLEGVQGLSLERSHRADATRRIRSSFRTWLEREYGGPPAEGG